MLEHAFLGTPEMYLNEVQLQGDTAPYVYSKEVKTTEGGTGAFSTRPRPPGGQLKPNTRFILHL